MNALAALKATVEYEDTRNLGKGKKYHEVKVPWGGSLFPAYHLNHSYVDCDVYVSLAKLKNHATAGVTMGIKNNFGITPPALYSHHQPNERAMSARVNVFHTGQQRPADGLPQEVDPKSPRRPSYRVPRHTVDSIGIRPIDLTIIDGIETVSGGEGPWLKLAVQKPGLLLAGRNPVCTDSIGTVVMGYDPMAAPATGPFPGDNHLAMAAKLGLGTNNPKEIDVVGLSINDALHPFRWEPRRGTTDRQSRTEGIVHASDRSRHPTFILHSQKQTPNFHRSRHRTFTEPSANEPRRHPAFCATNSNQLISRSRQKQTPNFRIRRSRHPTFAEPSADEPRRQPAFCATNPNQLIWAFDSRRQ